MAKPIPDDAEILMRIGHHPKVALALGLFVAAYAGLELALWRLYAKVLGHPHEGQTIQLIGGIQSFVHKMEAVERYLPHSRLDQAKCKEAFAAAKAINSFRNDLMHGIYVEHSEGTLWLYSGRTDPTRKLTEELIRDEADKAFKLARRILIEFLDADPTAPDAGYVSLLRK